MSKMFKWAHILEKNKRVMAERSKMFKWVHEFNNLLFLSIIMSWNTSCSVAQFKLKRNLYAYHICQLMLKT